MKHFHVTAGLEGGYLPDYVAVFENRDDAGMDFAQQGEWLIEDGYVRISDTISPNDDYAMQLYSQVPDDPHTLGWLLEFTECQDDCEMSDDY